VANESDGCCIERELVSRARPVVNALCAAGLSVVTAESCTAGLIAAILSHAPHASDCLHGGFVTYTKEHKSMVLGVSRELLAATGAVNQEVALQMARGALERSPANVAVSVTGVLGPDPDEDGNPPGLVYIAVARAGRPDLLSKLELRETPPDKVRRAVVVEALELLTRGVG
jgi:nicotinamide-nucleotide amidase